jgi:ABC-2 type transport system ATP-binding protein
MNAIEIKGLTKEYKGFTLGPMNLNLPEGSIMGVIGENGAGKSTTIKLILNLIHQNAGEITVLGQKMNSETTALREEIGVVMDEPGFSEAMTVRNIEKVMRACYRTWDSAAFAAYCAKFALPEKQKVKTYSRGMKMKLSIASALSHGSRLLILDEATSGLDPIVREEILDVFREFIQNERNSVFISSHIISDLEKICDYIAFIHKGKLLLCEEKDELLAQYVVAKLSRERFAALDRAKVIGARESAFGTEVLMKRRDVPHDAATENASLEDIMLYFVKGEQA